MRCDFSSGGRTASVETLLGEIPVEVEDAVRSAPHAVVGNNQAERVIPVRRPQAPAGSVQGGVDVAHRASPRRRSTRVMTRALGVVIPPIVVAHGIALGEHHGEEVRALASVLAFHFFGIVD